MRPTNRRVVSVALLTLLGMAACRSRQSTPSSSGDGGAVVAALATTTSGPSTETCVLPEGSNVEGRWTAFRPVQVTPPELEQMLASVPELASLASLGSELRVFDEKNLESVFSKSTTGRGKLTFWSGPLMWNPEPAASLLVVAGRARTASFIVAFCLLPNAERRLASAYVFRDEAPAIAFVFDPLHPRELAWTSCWGCLGEEGSFKIRADRRVAIVQH